MDVSIDALLDSYNVTALQGMADAAALAPPKSKKLNKQSLVLLLKEKFFTAERVKASYAKLNAVEKAVLNRLLLHGGQIRTVRFQRELVRAEVVTEPAKTHKRTSLYRTGGTTYSDEEYTGTPANPYSTVFQDVIARLTYHGLVFSRAGATNDTNYAFKLQFHPASELFIPSLVQRHLPAPEPIAETAKDWRPARTEQGDPLRFLRDLYLYWDFVRREEVTILQTGFVGKRTLRALNQTLLTPDPTVENADTEMEAKKLYLLRQLLQILKLIEQKDNKLIVSKQKGGSVPEFWSNHLTAQITACVRAWIPLPEGSERKLMQVTQYYPQYGVGRQTLLGLLRAQGTTVWSEAGELLEEAQGTNECFLFPSRGDVEGSRNRHYYYGGGFQGAPAQILKNMDDAEADFIHTTLAGFLFDCGLIELGYAETAAPTWISARLSSLGARVLADLDLQKSASPGRSPDGPIIPREGAPALADRLVEDQGKLVVQPNFQLLAIGPLPLATLAQLDQFAERRKADIGVFEYHLSRDSVYQAQQNDLSIAAIIAFLQRESGADLPQNLRRSLEEWGAHHERIIFRSGVTLLQAADESALTVLSDRWEIDQNLARVLAPAVALVKKGQEAQLQAALLRHDLLPAIADDKPVSADHSVLIDAQGAIQSIHAVPNLHLKGRLARIAEQEGDGRWQLTAQSVRKATGSRKKVDDLLTELGKLQRGALPRALIDQVKRWGAYFGDASAATVTLLEFRSRQDMDDLLQAPALRSLLTPFPAGDRALVVVAAGKFEEVRAHLTEYAVIVKDGLG